MRKTKTKHTLTHLRNQVSYSTKSIFIAILIPRIKLNTLGKEKIILGIDPGTTIMGFGLIKKKGSKLEMIMMDLLLLNKIKDPYLKLQKILKDKAKRNYIGVRLGGFVLRMKNRYIQKKSGTSTDRLKDVYNYLKSV